MPKDNPAIAASELAAIEAVLNIYFDGLHEGDPAKLAASFHPLSHLYCAVDGKIADVPAPQWFEMVKNRPSPKSKGAVRTDKIISIDLNGPVTAFAKVQCSIPPRHFTDYLSLVKLDGRWQVIAKAYHYDVRD
jgi:hypothetical protein